MARRFLAAIALVLFGAVPSLAGEPTDRLRTFFERANRIILAPELEGGVEERVTAVRALVNGIFDFDGASALALGRHWEPLPSPARAAFTRLYADVIERAYLAWVGGKARVGEGGVTIRWLGEAVEHDAATVSSLLLTRTGGEFPIEYRMVRRANDWLVRDVVVDGVSLAANYHVQFERVLQLGSYDELVDRLREKAGPVARAQATASAVRAMVAAPAPVGPPPRVVATPAAPDPPSAAAVIVAEVRAPMTGVVASDAAPRGLAPPAPRREFWVQVGAFHTTDVATRLVQRLRRHAVTMALGGDRQGLLARVLVGPFAERAAAVSTVRALHARGLAAFLADSPE